MSYRERMASWKPDTVDAARFWLNLQSRCDVEAERNRLEPVLGEIRPLKTA